MFCAGGLVGAFGRIAIDGISKSRSLLINHTMIESTIAGTLIGLGIIAIAATYNNIFRDVNYKPSDESEIIKPTSNKTF